MTPSATGCTRKGERIKRKSISRVLSVLLILAFTIGASYSVFAASNERNSMIVDQDRENEILQRYQAEISLVEQNHNVMIDHIDRAALDLIKQEAVHNLNDSAYDFAGLMNDLSVIFAEQEVLEYYEGLPATRANDVVIDNMETVVLHGYGALGGQYDGNVARGMTTTKKFNFSISLGGNIHGIAVSGSVTFEASRSISGPGQNDTLYNGKQATHNFACAILFGTITRTTWDLVDRVTGEMESSHETVQIPLSTSDTVTYTSLASIHADGSVEVNSADPDYGAVSSWDNLNEFRDEIEEAPYKYLKGSASASCDVCGQS